MTLTGVITLSAPGMNRTMFFNRLFLPLIGRADCGKKQCEEDTSHEHCFGLQIPLATGVKLTQY
jgi:hypothetical protein